ncbi:MAG: hypothetical protein V7K47_08785 [Nostoc sp.]
MQGFDRVSRKFNSLRAIALHWIEFNQMIFQITLPIAATGFQ